MMVMGGASVYAGGENMLSMKRGESPSLNNSGAIGLITSCISDNPRVNAVATFVDIAINIGTGVGVTSLTRSALLPVLRYGGKARMLYESQNTGVLSSGNRFSTEALADKAVKLSLSEKLLLILGNAISSADSVVNSYRKSKENCN
jgi:hypothetical protein